MRWGDGEGGFGLVGKDGQFWLISLIHAICQDHLSTAHNQSISFHSGTTPHILVICLFAYGECMCMDTTYHIEY